MSVFERYRDRLAAFIQGRGLNQRPRHVAAHHRSPDATRCAAGAVDRPFTGLEPLEPRILLSGTPVVTDADREEEHRPPGQLAVEMVESTNAAEGAAQIEARHVFYNHSSFDGEDAGPGEHNDAAIASDKQALLPGETASFANYTSYSRGLNGVMIDVAAPAQPGMLGVDDFEFLVGNNNEPASWDEAPDPIHVHVRDGDGVGDSARVELIWEDNAIEKTWLEVTVLANEVTGLDEPDVFYFGNAIGETGHDSDSARVDLGDVIRIRENQTGFDDAAIDNPYDLNREGRVTLSDVIQSRNNQSGVNPLELIELPRETLPVVEPVLDEARQQVATIDQAGGVLTGESGRGDTFELTLPEHSLDEPMETALTPLADVKGMPFEGELLAGADLEPDGLELRQPGELRIEVASDWSLGEIAVFGYNGTDSEMAMVPFVVEQGAIHIPLFHFSGYAVAEATAAERAELGDLESIEGSFQELARLIQDGPSQGLDNAEIAEQVGDKLRQGWDDRVRPAFAQAMEDFRWTNAAFLEFLSWTGSLAGFAVMVESFLDETLDVDAQARYDEGASLYNEVVHNGLNEVASLCADEREPGYVTSWLGMVAPTFGFIADMPGWLRHAPESFDVSETYEFPLGADDLETVRDCLTFELEVDITAEGHFNVITDHSVGHYAGEATLRADMDAAAADQAETFAEWLGALSPSSDDFIRIGGELSLREQDLNAPCYISHTHESTEFEITIESIHWADPFVMQPDGEPSEEQRKQTTIQEVVVETLDEGDGSITFLCPDAPGDEPQTIDIGSWLTMWFVFHEEDLDEEAQGHRLADWEPVDEGAELSRREFSGSLSELSWRLEETWTIRHASAAASQTALGGMKSTQSEDAARSKSAASQDRSERTAPTFSSSFSSWGIGHRPFGLAMHESGLHDRFAPFLIDEDEDDEDDEERPWWSPAPTAESIVRIL